VKAQGGRPNPMDNGKFQGKKKKGGKKNGKKGTQGGGVLLIPSGQQKKKKGGQKQSCPLWARGGGTPEKRKKKMGGGGGKGKKPGPPTKPCGGCRQGKKAPENFLEKKKNEVGGGEKKGKGKRGHQVNQWWFNRGKKRLWGVGGAANHNREKSLTTIRGNGTEKRKGGQGKILLGGGRS